MERNSFLIVSKEVLANKSFPASTKLLFAQLLDHRNKRTGQCNPHEATLALALLVSRRTIIRGLARLKEAGLIQIIKTQRGNRYEFPEVTECHSGSDKVSLGKCQSVTSETSGPLYEPYIREPSTDRAQNPRAAGASFPHKYKNSRPPAAPRKTMQQATMEAYHRMFGHVQEG